MAKLETVNIKSEGGYTTINKSDYNPTRDELFLKDGEILVKPLNVEGADPFVIDEKDFDANSYEKASKTKANLDIVAQQTDRETLAETLESPNVPSQADNQPAKETVKETPQKQLKDAQKKK